MSNSEWQTCTLEQICNIRRGASPRPIDDPAFFANEGRGWVRIADVSAAYKYLRSTEQYLSELGVSKSVPVEPGQLVMSICATIGKPIIIGIPVCIHDGFVLLDDISEEIDTHYLFYFLLKNQESIQKNQQVGTQGNINTSIVKKIEFLKPPLEEQRAIAHVLDTLDDAIQATEAMLAKQEKIKQGLLQDLLTRGVDESGRLRPHWEEAPELYQKTEIGLIPKAWNLKTIVSVSQFITSGSRGWANYYAPDGALFVRIGNLTRSHINFRLDDKVFVSLPENAEGKRSALVEGDVLVSITADLGIIAVVPPNFGEAYINQHIALIRPNTDTISPRWMGHIMSSRFVQHQIELLNDSGAKAGLNLTTIENLLIGIPQNKHEAEKVVALTDEVDKKINHIQNDVQKLKAMKAGLMQDLLTGERRITPELVQEVAAICAS